MQSWTKELIVKLPMKGYLRDCGYWRRLTLLNTVYKIVATIIQKTLQGIKESLRDEQAGFRPNRSCVDQANTFDFKKALDSIKQYGWRLAETEFPPK